MVVRCVAMIGRLARIATSIVMPLALASMLVGCDQLWSLQHIDETPTDARDDVGSGAGDGHQNIDCKTGYDLDSTVSPSRYRYIATLTSWDLALTMCQNDDVGRTHLVVLTDDTERLDVLALLGQRNIGDSFWIGLSDRKTEGAYLWVTDEPVGMPPLMTPPWGPGQPDNEDNAQDCVRIGGAQSTAPGFFDDSQCSSAYYVLCECDGIPPEPANY